MLQFHLDRLWESAEATGLGPAARAEGRQSLERRATEAVARAMESFWEGEFKADERVYLHEILAEYQAKTIPRPPV